jgi:hypothetical protein
MFMKAGHRVGIAAVCGAAVLAYVGATMRGQPSAEASPAPGRTASSAADARKRELLLEDANMGPDPALADEYDAINADYFSGRLSSVPVRWEERLDEIGPLIAEGFRLEGLTDGPVILLNPVLRTDAAQVRRTLCHEMVHIDLWAHKAGHGPLFQTELRQLADAGAFSGTVATDDEKAQLRDSLRTRALELDHDGRELKTLRDELETEGSSLDAEIRRINADKDVPPGDRDAATGRSAILKQRADDFNTRLERYNAALAEYDRDVDRYNLMIAYPDGLDEERMASKSGLSPER